jgi:L-ascorbate metabolism protein UlaG (beta-lactamase superfamily)
MDINWLGHSCFKIRSSNATVITDPYSPDLGYSLGKVTADIVTVSHQHPGHSYARGVDGKPRLISRPGEYEVSDVLIMGVATFHDEEGGAKRGKNTLYLMEMGEVSICHVGDLGHTLSAEQTERVGNVDVLLLPVGGVSTINASVAAKVVRQLEPKIVIPMHYKTPAVNLDLEPVDGFLKELGITQAESRPKLTITKQNLPLTTQVVLLSY